MSVLNCNLSPGGLIHGRYRVLRALRAGAMGAVYEVFDERTDAPRALKVMLPHVAESQDLRARFELEARIAGRVESDHVVRVFDTGIDESTRLPFLVMELLRGEDLRTAVRRRGPLAADEVVLYLEQAACALDKLHAAGVVHRDLKPDNLFLTQRDDGSPCVKILDFGVARRWVGSSGQATMAVGTPLYMAPEQILGDGGIGPQADIHALAHIAYALLTGAPYWDAVAAGQGGPGALLSAILQGPEEAPSVRAARRGHRRLPESFDAWFLQATSPRPELRFARAGDAVGALREALAGEVPPSGLLSRPSMLPAATIALARTEASVNAWSPPSAPAQVADPVGSPGVSHRRIPAGRSRLGTGVGVLIGVVGLGSVAAAVLIAHSMPAHETAPILRRGVGSVALGARFPAPNVPEPARSTAPVTVTPQPEAVASSSLPVPAPAPAAPGSALSSAAQATHRRPRETQASAPPASSAPRPAPRPEQSRRHRGID